MNEGVRRASAVLWTVALMLCLFLAAGGWLRAEYVNRQVLWGDSANGMADVSQLYDNADEALESAEKVLPPSVSVLVRLLRSEQKAVDELWGRLFGKTES